MDESEVFSSALENVSLSETFLIYSQNKVGPNEKYSDFQSLHQI